jgi:hypothetical protein
VTLIKLHKIWGIGLLLQQQELITVLGVNGEFASGIPNARTPKAPPRQFLQSSALGISDRRFKAPRA